MDWHIFAVDPPDGWVTAVVVGAFGALTAWVTTRRGEKSDKIQQEHAEVAALIQGYSDQIEAYTRIVADLQSEVKRLRDQYEADRNSWRQERTEAEILRGQLAAKVKELEAELVRIKNT